MLFVGADASWDFYAHLLKWERERFVSNLKGKTSFQSFLNAQVPGESVSHTKLELGGQSTDLGLPSGNWQLYF